MSLKYQKFGLRRDKNLSDLSNPIAALGNLLNDLTNADFIPDDLLQAVTGLRNTTLTVEDIQKTQGTVRTYTSSAGIDVPFEPLQTLNDNIRNFKTYLGTPPFGGGGDGVDALFVPWDAMKDIFLGASEATKRAWTGSDLFDAQYVAPDKIKPGLEGPFDFWDNGIFLFGAKLYSGFTDTYGLVQWEGYAQGGQRLNMETTGLVKIEIDLLDDGNWTFLKNIYDEVRTGINIASAVYNAGSDTTELTLTSPEDLIYVCVEDNLDIGDGNLYVVNQLVYNGGIIVVSGDATANSVNTFPVDAALEFTLGTNQIVRTDNSCRIPNTALGSYIKFRISYYFPNYADGRIFPEKRFSDYDLSNIDRIPYSNFYKELPSDAPGIYTYEYFEANRLSKRNKFMSPRNRPLSPITTALDTSALIYANYTPPAEITTRYLVGASAEYLGFGKFRAFATNTLRNVEVGSWLVIEAYTSTGRKPGVFAVQGVTTDETTNLREIYVDADEFEAYLLTSGNLVNSTVFVHPFSVVGLIGFVALASNGTSNQFTISNYTGQKLSYANMTSDLRSNYMVSGSASGMDASGNIITQGPSFTHFKRIFKNSNSLITTSSIYPGDSYAPVSTVGNIWIGAVYSHSGLEDLSSASSCAGTYGIEVAGTTSTNPAVLQLTSTTGITVGDYVQFGNTSGGLTYTSAYIPDNVKVQSVDSGTQITLDTSLIAAIPQNATIVFISPGNWTANSAKEFCVLPLNTAPPFIGTEDGLRTTSTTAPYSDSANFPSLVTQKLTFAEAEFPDITSLTPLNLSANPAYTRTLIISSGGTNYKVLIA
jgi:hypothetical protein